MATATQNFEGTAGNAPSAPVTSGGNTWTWLESGGGCVLNNGWVHGGSLSGRVSSASLYALSYATPDASTQYLRGHMKQTAQPGLTYAFARMLFGSYNAAAMAGIRSDGKFWVGIGTDTRTWDSHGGWSSTWVATTAISATAEYRWEVEFTGNSIRLKVWVGSNIDTNGTPDYDSGTLVQGGLGSAVQVAMGVITWDGSAGYAAISSGQYVYMDDFASSTTGWVGPVAGNQAGAAALTATSTLTAGATITRPAAAALAAAAVLVAAAGVAVPAACDLTSTSTLTATGTTPSDAPSAALTATSTLTAGATADRPAAAALTAVATLVAGGTVPTYYPGNTRLHARPTIYDSPHDPIIGGPPVLGTIATEVEAISDDLNEAMLEGPGPFPTIRAAFAALWSALSGKANSSHSHAAGDLTSGTIAAARLPDAASGVKGAVTPPGGTSNYLRADGTWAAPPGGGSSSIDVSCVFVEDYGAVADGGAAWILETTSGSAVVTAPSYYRDTPFRSSDVGKTIRISPADFATASVTRTILSVAGDGKSATLSANLGFTSANAIADWGGTDNTSAIQDAIDDAHGRWIVFGPGVYRVTGQLVIPNGMKMRGVGWPSAPMTASTAQVWHHPDGTTIQLDRGVDTHLLTTDGVTHTNNVTIENMRLVGSTEPTTTKKTINAVHSLTSDYAANWRINDVYGVGGQHALYSSWVSQIFVKGGVWGLTRSHAIYLSQAPDCDFTSVAALADTLGGAGRAALWIGTGSDHCVINGGFYQFSSFGVVLESSGNTFNGARIDSVHNTSLVITGNRNVVTGVNCLLIPSGLGYSEGSKYGVYITGNNNTVVGCGTTDPNGRMLKGHVLAGTADGNVVIPGATTAAHLDTASGTNVLITS